MVLQLVPFEDRSLDLPSAVTEVLLEAHSALYAHLKVTTQDQAWRCIRKLALCLKQTNLAYEDRLPGDTVSLFYEWLASKNLQGSTKQSLSNVVRAVVSWISRNRIWIFSSPYTPDQRSFQRQQPKKRNVLDRVTAEKVLKCALNDIVLVENRLAASKIERETLASPRAKLVARLLEIGKGKFPTTTVVARSKESLARRVLDEGGLDELRKFSFLTYEDILPFYLAIQLQIAGNPHATANIKRDCIESNPLRDDREWITWIKPRAAKIQRVDFPSGKLNSAPSLIRRLKRLNEALVPKAGNLADRLFLAISKSPGVSVPSAQSLHNELAKFLKRHELPDFDFVDLRRTNAVLHHQAGESIIAAKKRLNQKSVATTARYTNFDDLGAKHNQVIASNQNALQAMVVAQKEQVSLLQRKSGVPAHTVFGFTCADPFDGYGDLQGRHGPCDHFFRCATCPGAMVPLDSPYIVSKLLAARNHLLLAKEEFLNQGRIARFDAIYQPTLDAIEKKLLPFVIDEVMRKAEELGLVWPMPELE